MKKHRKNPVQLGGLIQSMVHTYIAYSSFRSEYSNNWRFESQPPYRHIQTESLENTYT